MRISELKLDLKSIDEGSWVDDIPELPGVALLVRGTEYEPYGRAMRLYHQRGASNGRKGKLQQLQQLQKGDADQEKFVAYMGEQMAEHLLLGWEGLDSDENAPDGTPIPLPYSKELAKRFMTEREYKPFRNGVMFAVEYVDAGAVEHRETAAKN